MLIIFYDTCFVSQVHLIEKQEAKRQVLKKRAEQTKVDSDNEINWDEDDDDLENVQDIPGKYHNTSPWISITNNIVTV